MMQREYDKLAIELITGFNKSIPKYKFDKPVNVDKLVEDIKDILDQCGVDADVSVNSIDSTKDNIHLQIEPLNDASKNMLECFYYNPDIYGVEEHGRYYR